MLERLYTNGYRMIEIPMKFNGNFHLHYYPQLGRIMREVHPEVVHIDEEPYNLATYLAMRLARQQHARALFFTWQNIDQRYPPPFALVERYTFAHATSAIRRLTLRRWFGFLRMQTRVVRRLPRIITVSESSKRDIADQLGVRLDRMTVVPVGVDQTHFRPLPHIARVPGRIMTTASADVPMKGLVPLLEAVAKVRTERPVELVVVGRPREGSIIPGTIERLGLEGAVEFVGGVDHDRIVELYAEAEAAVVPSLYEGFSLPAIEAMACGVPLVSTTGGALPEVVGGHDDTALLVPPGDSGALAAAISRLLDDPALRTRIGAAGRARVFERYTWAATAEGTVEQYRSELRARAFSARAAQGRAC